MSLFRSKSGSEARCTTSWQGAGPGTTTGWMGLLAQRLTRWASSSFLQPKSLATRSRLAIMPMTTEAPGWPLMLWNTMAGPSIRVGRLTVPPAPT